MARKKKKECGLIEDLIMVRLHVEFDTGYRSSKEMQTLVADELKAAKTALRTGVMVIPKQMTSPFTSAVSNLRTYYLEKSLPWDKGNWRVVPAIQWNEFKDELEDLIVKVKTHFNDCYVAGYDKLKTESEKQVGDLNVPFPGKSDLQERFSVEYKMGQVASPEDIRVKGIDNVVRKQIETDMKDQYEDKLNDGLTNLAKRLVTAAEDIGTRAGDPDQKSKKYTRSMENLQELADTVDGLNITGNDAIKQACETIREDISKWSPEEIKTTPAVREHIVEATGSVQDKLAGLQL